MKQNGIMGVFISISSKWNEINGNLRRMTWFAMNKMTGYLSSLLYQTTWEESFISVHGSVLASYISIKV